MHAVPLISGLFVSFCLLISIPIFQFLIPPKSFPDRIHSPLLPQYQKQVVINNNLYSEFAEEWFDSDGFAHGLHAINPTRSQYFYSTIIDFAIQKLIPKSKIRILEVGCGNGMLSSQIVALHLASPHKDAFQLDIFGIDPSKESVVKATEKATQLFGHQPTHSLQYAEGSIYDLSVFTQQYDVVLFSDVADHLLDLPLAFKQMNSVFKPNAPKLFLFETITRNIVSYWLLKVMGEQVFGLLPPDTHDYRLFVTPSEMNTLIQNYLHCQVNHVQGINPIISIPFFDDSPKQQTKPMSLLQQFKPKLTDSFLSNWILANYLGYASC